MHSNMTARSLRAPATSAGYTRGVTLVELMVSMAVGLVIVVALSAVFVSTSASRTEVQRSADVVENGRYALDALAREISQAGFYGPLLAPTGTVNVLCPAGAASAVVTSWAGSLAIPVQGLNNAQVDPTCLTRKAGTDAIFVQRVSTCAVGEAACEAETSANAYLQVSECGSEYTALPVVLGVGEATTFTLQTKACSAATTAQKRRLIRRIYYVDTNDVLSYIDFSLAGPSAPVAMVENIEQLQFEYALDTDGDGTAESYSSTPGNWAQVIGVRAWVLARSSTPSKTSGEAVTFSMGDTTIPIAAAQKNLKRRVYSSYIPLHSPKMRNEN